MLLSAFLRRGGMLVGLALVLAANRALTYARV